MLRKIFRLNPVNRRCQVKPILQMEKVWIQKRCRQRKKERLNRLMALQNAKSVACHEQLIGKTVEVLAEGPSKQADVWTGRSRTGVLVLWPVEGKAYTVGQKVNVLIDTAQTWLVKGKAVD